MIEQGRTLKKKKTTAKKMASRPQSMALAMHSAASPDWGTPMILRQFAQTVLRPAAKTASSIDLDYSSSAYWQSWWPGNDSPHAYLDGSKGRDVLIAADRDAACADRGSGFENPPGIGGGDMVQECWKLFEEDHREGKLGSGFWVGFSVEQFGSLQNVARRNPLSVGADDLITTIVPSRRAHYVLHPDQLIAITRKKMKKREPRSKQRLAELRLIKRVQGRTDDRPLDGGAPSHLSYVSILWSHDRNVRLTQMEAAYKFLVGQLADEKSLLHRFEVIGHLEDWKERLTNEKSLAQRWGV